MKKTSLTTKLGFLGILGCSSVPAGEQPSYPVETQEESLGEGMSCEDQSILDRMELPHVLAITNLDGIYMGLEMGCLQLASYKLEIRGLGNYEFEDSQTYDDWLRRARRVGRDFGYEADAMFVECPEMSEETAEVIRKNKKEVSDRVREMETFNCERMIAEWDSPSTH